MGNETAHVDEWVTESLAEALRIALAETGPGDRIVIHGRGCPAGSGGACECQPMIIDRLAEC